jgi:hypothetical protein
MSDLLRVYLNPAEIGMDGYPYAWRGVRPARSERGPIGPAIKDIVRLEAGHRCVRCGHPYRKGEHGSGEWSPCDRLCTHGMPARDLHNPFENLGPGTTTGALIWESNGTRTIEARWRILTVHHLNGIKHDCRWWNLAALCQRCHLSVQTRVVMDREYDREHSDWFKPYAAGWYAVKYLDEELDRDETLARLDELLALEHRQGSLL